MPLIKSANEGISQIKILLQVKLGWNCSTPDHLCLICVDCETVKQ